MSLEYYIRVYDNILTDDECDDIVKDHNAWNGHVWQDAQGNIVKNNHDLSVCPLNDKFQLRLDQVYESVGFRYSAETYKEYPLPYTRTSIPRLNRYTKGQHMDSHVDHIKFMFDGNEKGIPVLSTIIMLNDDFQGGDLLISLRPDNKKVSYNLKKGSIIAWPSIFMYEHEVTPIISGERYSMVAWFW